MFIVIIIFLEFASFYFLPSEALNALFPISVLPVLVRNLLKNGRRGDSKAKFMLVSLLAFAMFGPKFDNFW